MILSLIIIVVVSQTDFAVCNAYAIVRVYIEYYGILAVNLVVAYGSSARNLILAAIHQGDVASAFVICRNICGLLRLQLLDGDCVLAVLGVLEYIASRQGYGILRLIYLLFRTVPSLNHGVGSAVDLRSVRIVQSYQIVVVRAAAGLSSTKVDHCNLSIVGVAALVSNSQCTLQRLVVVGSGLTGYNLEARVVVVNACIVTYEYDTSGLEIQLAEILSAIAGSDSTGYAAVNLNAVASNGYIGIVACGIVCINLGQGVNILGYVVGNENRGLQVISTSLNNLTLGGVILPVLLDLNDLIGAVSEDQASFLLRGNTAVCASVNQQSDIVTSCNLVRVKYRLT